jgi:hypothetical protein
MNMSSVQLIKLKTALKFVNSLYAEYAIIKIAAETTRPSKRMAPLLLKLVIN